ncbi:MAG: type II CRISPR RNA-guided endonuclease Cas9 [Fusobacterium gastrosuis]|uniref:type II CRISPR RNA-guided endonuclease Cas9 n=1 Tax=Fusobacterium gastrosuis TaxID=1755100 RepID=UPI00297594F9|nr:type II CRISPR RNA-guided endonuclease Cas9 [Fusobacteriaceae bacterium]MDY4010981.1 type II CRISPR RNA-guided endonuclease Cas9 [Fusobacterium gastrosuis]MDY5713296.1 type II CRISPR RNA-guided endonuclease Cas9 [Fusobacterium gastrosuis]
MKKFDDYYLGLDLGTSSLGWAVTDEKYNILKFNKKFMWGTHLFETGNTAVERRGFRTGRRRLKRKKQRIELLQQLFSEEISKVDFGFYQRLKESQYWLEDKSEKNKNNLFMDKNYTDVDYHNEYPTIYHLRKALIDNEEKAFEVRKLYLAISHMLSHRGHFLFEGEISEISEFERIFEELIVFLREEYEIELNLKSGKTENDIKEILTNNKLSRSKKKEGLVLLFEDEKNKINQEIIKLLVGNEAKMSILFDNKDYEEAKINFSKGNYDEKEKEYEDILGEKILLVQKAKAIYDWMLLQNILKEEKYLSYSKVKIYEEHKEDLKLLKTLIKKDKKLYKEIFSENGLYEQYVRNNKKEELYSKIKKILETKKEEKITIEIKSKVENEIFLLKQKSSDNGVIPRQIHQIELEKILENASKRMEWLNKKDETGLSISEKIIKLFKFKIPYYVGPLNSKSPFAWIERKENVKITPWNFEEVVNIPATAEKFILKMTNKCTYLTKKDVIPKNSLLYQKFIVLNELNNLKIRGEKITVDLKQKIYEELLQKNKKVGMKQLLEYLKSQNINAKKEEITGIDGKFNTTLSSYIDMEKIFGSENIVKDSYKIMIEEIIMWITLYGEEKKLIKEKIKEKYFDKISEDQLKQTLKLKYKDWSRLSKEFLTEIEGVNKETGEFLNIIKMMWETNNNLMELLSYNYEFLENIEKYNNDEIFEKKKFTYEDLVSDLQVSPSVKKMIWKALVITQEIKKITKKVPKKIFIEMARDVVSDKKRTEKRKDKLLELYKEIKKGESLKELEQNLKNSSNDDLKSKKLYLYYIQLGKCMYSGEEINLSDLFNDNLYDIDHIYPQSKIKDDSFNNTVLVKKTINIEKTDEMLSKEIREKQLNFWTMLKEKGLITNEKYERLTRTTPFTDEELAGFINRQIVETRQATKVLANILKNIYGEDTRVVYVKAGLTSDFRQQFGIYKFRELNDYHHAHDGYLNIIVGNVYNTMFTDNPINFIKGKENKGNKVETEEEKRKKGENRKYNLKKVFEKETDIWNKDEMLPQIKRYVYKIRPLFTSESFERKGKFYDVQYKKKGKNLIPKKEGMDGEKYGGYSGIENSFFVIFEYLKGKKIEKKIDTIPIYLRETLRKDEEIIEYLKEKNKIDGDIKILIKNVKMNSKINYLGDIYCLRGKPDEGRLAVKYEKQLILKYENYEIMRKIIKNIENLKQNKELLLEKLSKLLKKSKNDKNLLLEEINQKLDNLFEELYFKVSNGEFSKIFSNITIPLLEYLNKSKITIESYKTLELYSKIRGIEEIFNVLTKVINFNLSDINGHKATTSSRLTISKIFNDDFYILNQSPTGLFEKKIYLPK